MAEKQYFMTIIKCAICKKEGVIRIYQGGNVEHELKNFKSGFKYGSICGGEWQVACHECFDKSNALMEKQKIEKENFLKGE